MAFDGTPWWADQSWEVRVLVMRQRAARRTYKAKRCETCRKAYTPTSAKQKRCEGCSPAIYKRRKYERKWQRESLSGGC